MLKSSLKGKSIVITRPMNQAESLTQTIQKVGGWPIHFPLIAISPLNDDKTHKQLAELLSYDILIFVSSNAVEQCLKHTKIDLLKQKILVTTGKKTAQVLINKGLSVSFYPEKYFNSEALLSIQAFREQAKGKKVAIIRGSNGRDYLKQNLITLGASVNYIDVYSRYCPQQDLNDLKVTWQKGKLDIVLLTSASSTTSFFDLAKQEEWINELTLLIGSPRMKSNIPAHFKGNIIIAEDPSDETILKTLTLEINKKHG